MLARQSRLILLAVGCSFPLAGCTEFQPFNSPAHLRQELAEAIGEAEAERIVIPFELAPEIREEVTSAIRPRPKDKERVEQVLDFIFRDLGLEYQRHKTLTAAETLAEGEGNCLSFVNLFVGIARELRLEPFYVEVTDYQRWRQRKGMVISYGHIVAGLYVDGKLSTFDFLPYRPKSYKGFKPIDDRIATAHYYNNLGAQALLTGDLERACELLETTSRIAPDFEKGINNLGVCLLRQGHYEEARRVLVDGLELHPGNIPLTTNLAHLNQKTGNLEAAAVLLDSIDAKANANPFFYVYRGELELARGELDLAQDYLKKALRLDNQIPEVHLALAKLHLELGDLERARFFLGRALKLDATHREALAYAQLIQERSNQGSPES